MNPHSSRSQSANVVFPLLGMPEIKSFIEVDKNVQESLIRYATAFLHPPMIGDSGAIL
jgi:hypothetical protein